MKNFLKILFFLNSLIFVNKLIAQVTPPEADQKEIERISQLTENHELSVNSKPKEGVPKGTIEKIVWTSDKIYP